MNKLGTALNFIRLVGQMVLLRSSKGHHFNKFGCMSSLGFIPSFKIIGEEFSRFLPFMDVATFLIMCL